ncbi:MAG: class I SAM-dependent methyltransferase [Planctomycetota bacterium]
MATSSASSALYGEQFFASHAGTSFVSAQLLLPVVFGLFPEASPVRSVIDVGCGTGTWLRAARELGASEVLGIDGGFVPLDQLEIRDDRFVAQDLRRGPDLDALPRRDFDLAMSLEVAEHLPDDAGDALVEALCTLAPVVLFSAAVPMQGGTGHINERWQQDWADRFADRGYRAIDAVRPRVWEDDRIAWWYRQNTIVYASDKAIEMMPVLRDARGRTRDGMLSLVHPILLEKRNRKPLRPMSKVAVMRAWVRATTHRKGS